MHTPHPLIRYPEDVDRARRELAINTLIGAFIAALWMALGFYVALLVTP